MARDYSRLFDLAGGMQKREPVMAQPTPDLFGGGQHQQAVAEQSQNRGGIMGSLIDAGSQVAGAYMNKPEPQLGGQISAAMHKPAASVAAEATPLGQLSDLSLRRPEDMPFGGYRAYGGMMYPGRRYQIGDEQVAMNEDGTAQVIPGDDPAATAQIERAASDDPARPPWNRVGPSISGHQEAVGKDYDPMMEPSPYDGRTRTRLPENATNRERALQEIQDFQRAGPRAQRQSSMWRRIGQGVLGGLAEWGAAGMPGDWGGAIGAAGTGAAIYGAAPGTASEMEHRRKLAGLFGNYKEAVAPEMAETARLAELQKARGEVLKNEGQVVKNTNDRNQFLMEQLKQQGFTPDEVADYLRGQGIPAIQSEARKFEDMWDAQGMPQSRPERGTGIWRPNPSAGVDPSKRQVPVTISGDQGSVTGWQTGSKAVDTAATLQQGNARMAMEERNRQRIQANEDRDYQLRRDKFDLDVKQEERMLKQAQGKYGDGPTGEWAKDLQKAREAVLAVREEIAGYGQGGWSVDDDEQYQEDRAQKLSTLREQENKAMALYRVILQRMQNGSR